MGPRIERECLSDDGNLAVDGETWDEAVVEHMMPAFPQVSPIVVMSWELWWAVAGEMWLMHAVPRRGEVGGRLWVWRMSCYVHGESESESEILLQRRIVS